MSILASYREKEELIKKLREEMSKLEENQQLKKELEFKKAVEALLEQHGRSVYDILDIFGLNAAGSAAKASATNRRGRKLKVYVNPNTGERIETRGGNHKLLKEWKQSFGADTVEGWLIEG